MNEEPDYAGADWPVALQAFPFKVRRPHLPITCVSINS